MMGERELAKSGTQYVGVGGRKWVSLATIAWTSTSFDKFDGDCARRQIRETSGAWLPLSGAAWPWCRLAVLGLLGFAGQWQALARCTRCT